MILLFDIGNSRVKWAEFDGGRLRGQDSAARGDQAAQKTLTPAFNGKKPSRMLAANVGGPLMGAALSELAQERFGLKPEFLIPAARACGVENGYTDPTRLGSDRWAAVIGAFKHFGGPVCVFDAGTAITVDVVTKDGRHLGGLIAPGPGTMRRALAGATAGIGDLGEGELALLCRDTRSAVSSGGWHAAAGFIERIVELVRKQVSPEVRFLLTGGDAERLRSLLPPEFTLCPDLVLQGLAVVAENSP